MLNRKRTTIISLYIMYTAHIKSRPFPIEQNRTAELSTNTKTGLQTFLLHARSCSTLQLEAFKHNEAFSLHYSRLKFLLQQRHFSRATQTTSTSAANNSSVVCNYRTMSHLFSGGFARCCVWSSRAFSKTCELNGK